MWDSLCIWIGLKFGCPYEEPKKCNCHYCRKQPNEVTVTYTIFFLIFATCHGCSFFVLGSYECMSFLRVVNCKLYSVYSVYCIWCIEFGRMTISFSLHVVPRWRSPFNHFRSEPSLSFFSKPVALSTFESPLPPSVIAAPAFCYSCSPLPPVVGVTSSSCGRRHVSSSFLPEIFVS